MYRWIDGQINRWKDEKMERWIDAQVDGKDRWMERIDRQKGWKERNDRWIQSIYMEGIDGKMDRKD